MKDLRTIITVIVVCFGLFCAWDYVSFNLRQYESRIAALEASARPLFIVDKYSMVQVDGHEVYAPTQVPATTLAEEIKLADNSKEQREKGVE
jgi:hypothetical protein